MLTDTHTLKARAPRAHSAFPEAGALRRPSPFAICGGSSELPSMLFVRHCLFPITSVLGLLMIAALYAQPFTRPYFILAVLAFLLSWKFMGTAECNESGTYRNSVTPIFFSWIKVLGVLFFLGFIAKNSDTYSRAVVITWALAMPLLFATAQIAARRILCDWNRRGRIARTHIIVGTNSIGREMATRLERDGSLGTFIGFFDHRVNSSNAPSANSSTSSANGLLGELDDLPEYVRRNSIDVVHIACPLDSDPHLGRLLDELRDTTASIYFLLDVPGHEYCPTRIVDVAGIPSLAYFETPHWGTQAIAKRLIDFAIALVLLLLLWPVLLAIAIAIRLDSKGPVVFKQRRYGLKGEEFFVYKFRSMTVCEDGNQITQAQRNDPRVTKLGSFLRRTSLDELPQLFCVLNGSMSLVGPRPHAVAHNEQYRRLIDGYMLRHKVRPGITGWAQVNGLRGETRTIEQMRARVSYDLEYLRHWSPWIDIKILLRTALLVIRDRNAY